MNRRTPLSRGFTIIELITVIVVVGILAALTIVAFNGVRQDASGAVLQADLRGIATTVEAEWLTGGTVPVGIDDVNRSPGTNLEFARSDTNFCVTASSQDNETSYFYDSVTQLIEEGMCPGHIGSGPAPAVAVSTSDHHTCAVAGGEAFCWGLNSSGQLGDTSTSNSSIPVAVSTTGALSGKNITKISANGSHTCVVATGEAFCWGSGASGQLGNNSTANTSTPVAVSTAGVLAGKTVTSISSGNSHTCAVAGGEAFCWGWNNNGQLGNNSTSESPVPVTVSAAGVLSGRTVTGISAGSSHTCALADGLVFCWGAGTSGRLGNNSTTQSTVPVAVSTAGVLSGRTVTAISGPGSHTCAIADGLGFCWGLNIAGRLGNNSTTLSTVPVAVSTAGVLSGRTLTSISGYNGHTCAIADGEVFCWGLGSEGRLGNDDALDSLVPVAVSTAGVLAGKTATFIAQGGSGHSCAIADGDTFCWGGGYFGKLGNDSVSNSSVPVAVNPLPIL